MRFQQSVAATGNQILLLRFPLSGHRLAVGAHRDPRHRQLQQHLPELIEIEKKGSKKNKRVNALYGSSNWLSDFGGAVEFTAADPGIGVSATKLEYESSAGKWEQIAEHNYLSRTRLRGRAMLPIPQRTLDTQ